MSDATHTDGLGKWDLRIRKFLIAFALLTPNYLFMRVVLDWFLSVSAIMLKSKLLVDHEGDKMVLTCAQCQHEFSQDVSNLILVVGKEATLHTVRSRAVCRQCNIRGDKTYRMVPKSA